ncbi:phospholipase D-like domain-containing protein [Streptoalloteichus hindustanus]|uniref:phospholipase D n=1 Tax=Streptoalloteichus hindustanus TaxID=2017 RepID=A0A1M5ETN5_STRHI|nr:phospholipase D-like domain-containing protein [Streptoalloteichus hindustanus]SHF82441.1 Phosphatidylserine/phosphatidylglycerophosphate/cardiolipin synthase [Streptoalloteichus hindustanus]
MRFVRGTLAVLTALAALLLATPASPAVAVASGAVFNKPTDPARQYAIVRHLRSLIQGAAAGSEIHIAIYHFSDTAIADDLVAARDRGVKVRLVVDHSSADGAAVRNLVKALGTDRAKPSWVVLCTKGAACIGNVGTPIMHNKFFLFSHTNGSSNVVVQGSANLTKDNAEKYWNNAVTLVGDTGLYNGYLSYFRDLAAKKKDGDYYRTVSGDNSKAYFFPRAGNGASTDTIHNMLDDNVACEGNTTVGTKSGRTIIRIGMWYFSRDAIARKLRELADRKCWVEVIYTTMDAGSRGHLSNHDRIVLRQIDGAQIVHSKYMLIEGTYAGVKNSKWVMTGSHNYTNAALRENDETLLRIRSDAIHDQYRANFNAMRASAAS